MNRPIFPSPEPEVDDDLTLERQARDEVAAGRYVSWEAVERWMKSWGQPEKLPRPKVGD